MKPHEETWKRSHLLVVVDEGDGHDLGPTCFGSGALPFVNHDADIARLTLAAQAPAMARLLLHLATHSSDSEGRFCPSCCGETEETFQLRDHGDDCELVAVLRAAGVVE